MEDLKFKELEEKWQNIWEEKNSFKAFDKSDKPKWFILEMFPYPSGSGLHMGHAWNYTIGDIMARFKRLAGFNVMHPMGYDALGLPAENAAIKEGEHPQDYTNKSIENFTRQLKEIGISYDWSRTFSTADKTYYKWDQWIFLKMLEKDLAYQKTSSVNWCPECNTVLANEQVIDGKCWRHEETNVQIKYLKQWFLKITNYADELYENLDKMDWPEKTKAMQKNWIGKSNGTEIDFKINDEAWSIFTTRPDTIFGTTFLVVSAQHPRLQELITEEKRNKVEEFLKGIRSVSEKEMADMEKKGVFTGSYAINPINDEKIPVYAGNFVVADYGSGMVMAVPAHDQRDFEFAKKYEIEIKQVVTNKDPLDFKNNYDGKSAFTDYGLLINSKQFSGLKSEAAKEEIAKFLEEKNLGRKVTNFKLRDWGISRQRYWGTPIPIVHCDSCGVVPVPEKDLPIILPKEVEFGKGNPLETATDWIKTKCPKCGADAKREVETMDTFVNSSWYFFRYCDPKNEKEIFDKEKVKYWCPANTYIGGPEHACMHLIYSRFYTKFLRDLGLLEFSEPAIKLFHQGMLSGEGGTKMSKSKGTVVLPEVVSDKYGMDTARFFLSSLASPDKDISWSEAGIGGSSRFIKRIFELFEDFQEKQDSNKVIQKLNQSIEKIEKFYSNFEYRKATIEIRELFQTIEKEGSSIETLKKFLIILNPICPHITEELNEKIENKKLISESSWPKIDESKTKEDASRKDMNETIIKEIEYIIEKTSSNPKKIYIYTIPPEVNLVNTKIISEKIKKEVEIFPANSDNKYDPENKAKKAKKGKPSIYLE